MKVSFSMNRASAQLTKAISTSAAQHSRYLSSAKNPPAQDQQEQYTATDAANFSRLGASLTALPSGEIYKLPILPDREAQASHVLSKKVPGSDENQAETETDDKTKSELYSTAVDAICDTVFSTR
ncbi:hypothetical protein EG329_010426 [Mollisiaceae sp. DMI_Dod_QoI]|nr:hypothetical protein EG329_010426 [Helotiales sp. DMI_Dod_QoI]